MATFKPTVRGMRKDGFMQVYIRVTHRTKHVEPVYLGIINVDTD